MLAAAGVAVPEVFAEDVVSDPLKVRFLGTGAADWNGPDGRGEHRRLTSVLLDGRILIDYTATARDQLPPGAHPETIFYTHSHDDHYRVDDALALGSLRRVYVNDSWVDGAREEFAAAARRLGVACPEVAGLSFGQSATVGGIRFTSLPANHVTNRPGEHTSMYLVEKGPTRLLYATDTGGIPGEAARLAGLDAHCKGRPITALIMEATMGIDHADDFRIYSHSSVATVAQTVRVLQMTKRYCPRPGQKVYLTHMARTLHGTQREIEAAVPEPLVPAFDGLEVNL